MTIEATDWLPIEALVDPRLAARLDDEVGKWSERWLGSADICKFAAFVWGKAGAELPKLANSWRLTEAGLSCAWSEPFGLKLGLAIVDASDRYRARSNSDKALLTSLAWEAVSDLAKSAATSLGVKNASGTAMVGHVRQIGWQTRNTLKDLPELAFQMPASMLVPARKALIGSVLPPENVRERLSEACASTSLPVRAVLGKATIRWSECQNLESGDVVILDQSIENATTLLSAKSGSAICKLSIAEDDGRLKLLVADDGV